MDFNPTRDIASNFCANGAGRLFNTMLRLRYFKTLTRTEVLWDIPMASRIVKPFDEQDS